MSSNEYLLTIRLTTTKSLDPEAVGRIEGKVAELVRNTIWEASGVTEIKANVWGRHGEGSLEPEGTKRHHGVHVTSAKTTTTTGAADLQAPN